MGKINQKNIGMVAGEKRSSAEKAEGVWKKTKEAIRWLPVKSAQHLFLSCLVIFILTLILGGVLFYRYSFLALRIKPESGGPFLLDEKTYQEVLNVWQEKEKKFNEADLKNYPDPFENATASGEQEGLTR